MTILAVDYGDRYIGTALAQTSLAEGLMVVNTNEGVVRIVGMCRKYAVEKIIIGMPVGRLKRNVLSFGKSLGNATGLPVLYWDETLSSKGAQQNLILGNSSRKRRKEKEHQVAAALMLQSYLDDQAN